MRKKKEEDRGATQREIIRFILNHPEGVSEPTIRAYLEDKLQITDPSNIKAHLSKLATSEGVIKKERRRGGANRWRLAYENETEVSFYIIFEFLKDAEISEDDAVEALSVFNAKATQEFLKIIDWSIPFTNSIFRERDELIEADNFIFLSKVYNEAILISPTLFSEIFDSTEENKVITICLFHIFMEKIRTGEENLAINPINVIYQSKILASFIVDAGLYPEQRGKISEFIREYNKKADKIGFYRWYDIYMLIESEEEIFNNLISKCCASHEKE